MTKARELSDLSTAVPAVLNASGSAPVYAVRAWLLMDNAQSIQASGNVSSVTDISTGKFTVNFAVAMEDVNYAWSGSVKDDSGNGDVFMGEPSSSTRTASTVTIATQNVSLTLRDHNNVSITFVR